MKKQSCLAAYFALAFIVTASKADLVINGDFSAGNSGFTSSYAYTALINGDTQYTIGTNPSTVSIFGDWASFGDHTTGTGNMMIVNGASSPDVNLWSETFAVTANTTYLFSYWGATVNTNTGSATVLQGYINGSATGPALTFPQQYGVWSQEMVSWSSGSNTSVTLSLIDLNTSGGYNDFAVDDISFTAMPSVVPEPSSIVLCGIAGLMGLVQARKLHKRVTRS